MQQIPIMLLKLVLSASMIALASNAMAQQSLNGFENALEEAGWDVQREADGSLKLTTPEISGSTSEIQTATEDQWPELQKKLENAGWQVEREADGTLLLIPPENVPSAEPEAPPRKADNIDQINLPTLQRKLQAAGWHVSNSSDGGMLLYPPGKITADTPQPCPGTSPAVDVELPVDSWQEAHDIALGWLNSQPSFHAAVGKIRRILNVYLISIVSDTAPFNLKQQIAIRNSDGAVIVLN